MTGGGVNRGSAAFDPVNQIVYANTSRAIQIVGLLPRAEADAYKPAKGVELGQQRGAAYAMTRRLAISPLGVLCNKPPWGVMVAVDLKAGKILWESAGRHRGRQGSARYRLPLGHAAGERRRRHRGRADLHRSPGSYLHALRRQIRRRTVAGQAAGPRHRQSHDLPLERRAIRGYSQPAAIPKIGTRIGDSVVAFRLARQGEFPLAVVAHHRPARRTLPGQGTWIGACAGAGDRRALALASQCQDQSPLAADA